MPAMIGMQTPPMPQPASPTPHGTRGLTSLLFVLGGLAAVLFLAFELPF